MGTSQAVGVAPARVIHPAENAPESSAAASSVNWNELVDRIKANEAAGLEELYGIFSRGVRFYFCRQLGPQDLEDKVHDSFLIVVSAVRRGELREPERLMGFVRTIVRRQVAAYIDQVVHSRKQQAELDSGRAVADRKRNPEQVAIEQQQEAIAKKSAARHFAPGPGDSDAILPAGRDARADLRRNESVGNAIPAVEITGEGSFRRFGPAQAGPAGRPVL